MKSPGLSRQVFSATLFLGLAVPGSAGLGGQEIRPADPILMEPIDPQQARTAVGPVTPRSLREEFLERFDRNHDGRLDEAELAEVRKFAAERGLNAGGEPERLAIIRVVRAAIEADPALLRRFDLNQDGKLGDEEWAFARPLIAQSLLNPFGAPPGPGVIPNPISPEEKRRLDGVAAEMTRRRKAREEALRKGGQKD